MKLRLISRQTTPAIFRVALAFCAVAALLLPATAQTTSEREPESIAAALADEVRAVFERTKGSIARIEAQDRSGALIGTGFFIDPNGTLITSYSVGGESFNLVASYGDLKHPLKRLAADPRSGIAILQVEKSSSPTPFLPMGSSRELKVATPVVMVAYPLDLPLAPHFGMIAGFDGKYLDRYFATTHIRANVAVKRGQGGAPLLNMQGQVVGVVISGVDEGAACYALPVEAVQKIHRDYARFGRISPGRLGFKVEPAQNVTPEGSKAQVRSVDENSPAAQAGVRKGDVIEKIGPQPIQKPEDLLNACFFLTAGDEVELTLWRDGEQIVTQLKADDKEPVQRRATRASKGLFDMTLRPEGQ